MFGDDEVQEAFSLFGLGQERAKIVGLGRLLVQELPALGREGVNIMEFQIVQSLVVVVNTGTME